MATTPLPLWTYVFMAWRWASVSQTMPEFWSMTIASYCARLSSLKTVGSSLWTISKPFSAASSSNIVMPFGMDPWT